ncbi:DNA-binding protein [Stenotrophomonas sp. Sa5BUN4]|uniref:DNA-binding protein n=1 Tax=Stenotrophomonas lacuserhaii TaxID=2760084 RepID=A0A8X8FPR8_9GAMM|nr:DNA-binding protein [Stenotrophomonas pennii]MBD7952982.1 DNA-binding protein [Stenotrophomonas pennii]
MARGITELDVHGAADALVAKGERPTVERVRAHLGTGSPNTVTRLLDTWWLSLGSRLHPEKPSVKDAPAVVGKLAGQWWALALEHARDAVLAEFSEVRQELTVKQEELLVRAQALAGEMSAVHAKSEAALVAERLACAQATELQRLVDQLQLQAAELAGQRTSAIQRLEQVEISRQVLYDRLQETEESARSERETLAEHVRSVENRALGDLDRARQEAKTLQTKLASAVKRNASIETEMRHSLEKARSATAAAIQMADKQRGRCEALEDQLAKLQNLPADLEAALRRSQVTPDLRKTSTQKRAKKSSSKATK